MIKACSDAISRAMEVKTKADTDREAAEAVKALIDAIPANPSSKSGRSAVSKARDAYNALTDDQKKLVGDSYRKKLEDAEKKIEDAGGGKPAGGNSKAKVSDLYLRSPRQTNNTITLKWSKKTGAAKYVIYGNACGLTNKLKKVKDGLFLSLISAHPQ